MNSASAAIAFWLSLLVALAVIVAVDLSDPPAPPVAVTTTTTAAPRPTTTTVLTTTTAVAPTIPKPAPTTVPAPPTTVRPAPAAASSSLYEAWTKVAVCEEGGWVGSSGYTYPDSLGITRANWFAFGGGADVSPAAQIAVAERLIHANGASIPDQHGCQRGGW